MLCQPAPHKGLRFDKRLVILMLKFEPLTTQPQIKKKEHLQDKYNSIGVIPHTL